MSSVIDGLHQAQCLAVAVLAASCSRSGACSGETPVTKTGMGPQDDACVHVGRTQTVVVCECSDCWSMWIVAWRDMALWTVTSVCADRCNSTQFHCSRGYTCISADQECDGSTNCNDTSDEAQCCMLFYEIQYTFVSDSMIETSGACFLVCVSCC